MTEQTWVINASPLILLGKINQLNLVEQLLANGSYLSDSLVREALRKVGELP